MNVRIDKQSAEKIATGHTKASETLGKATEFLPNFSSLETGPGGPYLATIVGEIAADFGKLCGSNAGIAEIMTKVSENYFKTDEAVGEKFETLAEGMK